MGTLENEDIYTPTMSADYPASENPNTREHMPNGIKVKISKALTEVRERMARMKETHKYAADVKDIRMDTSNAQYICIYNSIVEEMRY